MKKWGAQIPMEWAEPRNPRLPFAAPLDNRVMGCLFYDYEFYELNELFLSYAQQHLSD